ncbi:glycerate kinase [Anaerosporomusa subterranea]|uniref:Glycerate kinase n=1 Tax=Anaerosporomusa subterranea TaxID=1794912 RepID=A0A154BSP5_ANASB|nr:glycerate kinase [Anaerosporomusa subterranea]KYZ76538.1 glycerate kinase [Anaerosporomusa subterranea]
MRIVVAPDSFKGSVSALGVAEAMERGIRQVFPDAVVIKVPIADGGEGTVEALVAATGGQIIKQTVVGPLGEPVEAYWGVLADEETAVIEMAAASGLPLLSKEKRDPRLTTTYGTGELIKAALDRGLKKIIIGIGGSATNDGGTGMARALGARFLDKLGQDLPEGGAALANLSTVDLSGLDPRLSEVTLLVACDVDNPLCGPRGASAVYGPQKGATPDMVQQLDSALACYANAAKAATGRDVARLPGAGAAGGLGAGLLFFTAAALRPGVEIVLETVGFRTMVEAADLVITGEGRTDFQTAFGKAPVGVAKIAKEFRKPVICLSGGLGDGADDVLAQGIDAVMSIVPGPMALEDCILGGTELLEAAAARLCRVIKVGRSLDC